VKAETLDGRYCSKNKCKVFATIACEELDQDDCGKGDHKEISLAWCQKEGYPKVKDYDVDSKKVKAETLDGRYCSKNKCKVFDTIACEM